MSFHLEISSPLDRARALDLAEADLRTKVLEPWVRGLPVEFAGRRWEPRECRLTVLEGPALAPRDDGPEEQWAVALETAADVTQPLLKAAKASAPAQTAVIVEAASVEAAQRELRTGQAPRRIPWASAVERIEARDPEVAAVILVVKESGPTWPIF
jgi:hypothetical protein